MSRSYDGSCSYGRTRYGSSHRRHSYKYSSNNKQQTKPSPVVVQSTPTVAQSASSGFGSGFGFGLGHIIAWNLFCGSRTVHTEQATTNQESQALTVVSNPRPCYRIMDEYEQCKAEHYDDLPKCNALLNELKNAQCGEYRN